ncbi:MAG: glutathione S-transferase family protein [Alphaproteobacteria bacterium]|nr:glutathione S-transferase family protein [Alphaproteobacteria bacterium]MCB9930139.1 glutathione S-transferase family protein [Alphaproteobacteria bacterium]
MTVTLYGAAVTRAARNYWAVEELGIDYVKKDVNMAKGEHKAPAYLAVNPNGKLPAMVDGDLTLFESMAINTYLADAYGQGSLQPDSAADRARADQWAHWVMGECEKPLIGALFHTLGIMGYAKDPAKVAEQRAALEGPLGVLDRALAGRDWLVGDRFTVADLNVASVLHWGQMARLDWAPHQNVAAWLDRCFGRPAFKKVGQLAKADMAKMNG